MIKITEGGLVDLWPERESPEIVALSHAIKTALDAARTTADTTQIYANIGKVPEDILDHLAVELRTMYYDQNFDIETKRTIIQNTLKWFTKAGTVAAVKELLTVAFGSGDIEEWFDYGGTPKHFNAVLPVGDGQAVDSMRKFAAMIESIKNVRSRLDSLTFEEKTRIVLEAEEGAYKTDPPLCGTFPDLSTAFDQDLATIALPTSEIPGQTYPSPSSAENDTGTVPMISAAFAPDLAEIGLETGSASGSDEMPVAGTFKANE